MYIDEQTKQEILDKATLEEALNIYCQKSKGKNKYVCPMCGKDMEYHPGKKLVKCFHCDWGTSTVPKLLMETTKCTFPEALERMAGDFHVIIPEKKYPVAKKKAVAKTEAWYKQQLADSGLTAADVRAWCYDGTSKSTFLPFRQGSVGPEGEFTEQGDDMVIHYLDLDGHQLMYCPTLKNGRAGEARPFFRVRWQIPESHTLRDGTICKYKSPAGSSVQLYIPEKLREAYRERRQLSALYFTEGEKKAEAVSRYVGPAFGLAGINCLVGRDKQLPEAIVRVIEACQVEKVYFIMDSDWDDLSANLDPEKDVRQRPQAFFSAAKNFTAWFQTLRNRHLYVDCYLVLGKKGDKKGVDDQLASLKSEGKENAYSEAIETGTNAAIEGGHTPLFDIYNITTMPEAKLSAIWHLDSIENFASHHNTRLASMESFRAWRNSWKIDPEKGLVLAQPLADAEQFWEEHERVDRMGRPMGTEYKFSYVRSINFLERRGFFRIKNETTGEYQFIHVDKNRITQSSTTEIKDFVLDTARCMNNEGMLDMLYRGSTQYLGPDKLNNMSTRSFTPSLPPVERDCQLMFFKSKFWRITAAGIEEQPLEALPFNYRERDLKEFDARLSDRMVNVEKTADGYNVSLSEAADKCDFLRFLLMTSWFEWDKQLGQDRRPKGPDCKIPQDAYLHLLSKMTAIGHLLHQYHDPSVAKAVIAMDESISAVGESHGRSGKSLIGKAIEQMETTLTLSGKSIDIANDRFVWDQVDNNTRLIIIDDLLPSFDFELLFPLITDSITVNCKGRDRFTLKGNEKPKFYLTTNHVIGRENGSTRDRQFKLAFSNYFDETYKPEMEYGRQFFSDDWDQEQWNSFYNLMAECLVLYFEAQQGHWGVGGSGLIAAPSRNLELRLLRQQMTETFFRWFTDFMNVDEDNPHDGPRDKFDVKLVRSCLYEDYKNACTKRELAYLTPQKFWQRLILWCRYFGFTLNPGVPLDAAGNPGHYKSDGTEYISIGE